MAHSATDSRKCWNNQLQRTLKTLQDTVPPDCYVLVGTERIPAHRTAVQLNSSLLCEDSSYNKETGVVEIELLPEFTDQVELVSEIVNSFYTGSINVTDQNMRMVYKFAKCYFVEWVLEFIRPMFIEHITKAKDTCCDRFVEVFKFAHSVWCTDLFDACIGILDDAMFKMILESDAVFKLDYFCLRTMTTSKNISVTEKNIFELVILWCSQSAKTSRGQHLGTLIQNINFNLIDKNDLSNYFDFVLDTPLLDETCKRQILRKLMSLPEHAAANRRKTPNFIEPDVDEELLKQIDIMKNDLKRNTDNLKREELNSILKEKFQYMDDDTREIVIDYMAVKNKVQHWSTAAVCLQLYNDVYQSSRLLMLSIEYYTLNHDDERYYLTYYISWERILHTTILAILHKHPVSAHLKKFDKGRFEGCAKIELIMLWSLANSSAVTQIKQLLRKICFRKVPKMYIELILLPFVKKIIPDTTELVCQPHSHNDIEPVREMAVHRAGNVCLLRDENVQFQGYDCFLQFYESNLTLRLYNGFNQNFILFDASKTALCRKYPLFTGTMPKFLITNSMKNSEKLCVMIYI